MSDPLKGLQAILGTDKKNPMFAVYRDVQKRELHVYYGFELLEVVPDDKNSPHFRLMVAQLYNAGLRGLTLIEVFGVDPKSMRKWGRALKSGDPETLVRALQCRGPRKLTPEVQAYIKRRFPLLYDENPRHYIPRLRQEILEIFNVQITAEGLRAFLNKLKAQRQPSAKADRKPASASSAKPDRQPANSSSAKRDLQPVSAEVLPGAPSPTEPLLPSEAPSVPDERPPEAPIVDEAVLHNIPQDARQAEEASAKKGALAV